MVPPMRSLLCGCVPYSLGTTPSASTARRGTAPPTLQLEVRVVDRVVLSAVVDVGNLRDVEAALARVVDVLLQLLPARVHQQEGLAPAGTETSFSAARPPSGMEPRGARAEGVHPGRGRAHARGGHLFAVRVLEDLLAQLTRHAADEVHHHAKQLERLRGTPGGRRVIDPSTEALSSSVPKPRVASPTSRDVRRLIDPEPPATSPAT